MISRLLEAEELQTTNQVQIAELTVEKIATVHLIEVAIHLIEAVIHLIEAAIHLIETMAHLIEAMVLLFVAMVQLIVAEIHLNEMEIVEAALKITLGIIMITTRISAAIVVSAAVFVPWIRSDWKNYLKGIAKRRRLLSQWPEIEGHS